MKAELKKNSVNQIIKDTNIFEAGDEVTEIGLVVKGRVRVHAEGINLVVGSGNFLGLCDLADKVHHVTYTAEMNSVVYSFPSTTLNATILALMKVNKDYAPLMVSTLSKFVRDLSKVSDELGEYSSTAKQFIKDTYQSYLEIGKKTGAVTNTLRSVEGLGECEVEDAAIFNLTDYYKACAELPAEIQKAYFGTNAVITSRHILEQVRLVNALLGRCRTFAEYLKNLAQPLVLDSRSLYHSILKQATMLQYAGENISEVTSLFDDVIDRINSLENLLAERADINLDIDHKFMEEAYFNLLNGTSGASADGNPAISDEDSVNIDELADGLEQIIEFAGLEEETAESLRTDIEAFIALPDKFSTDEDVRKLRRSIIKVYYDLYKQVFLKDYNSGEKTPIVIDLFLRYGFLSERLLTEDLQRELLALDNTDSGTGSCAVYDMKEWLTLILQGEKEPSKSEFDLDYDANLREMRKTGQITAEMQQEMSRDLNAKFDYEIQNLFRCNHRILFGQISAFVPFLFTEGCANSIIRSYLSKDKVNAAVQRLLHIDYSVFYRESLYAKEGSVFAKEYIQEEVFPDVLVMPCYGSKSVMWQELSGRRRNSKGRFLFPIFLEGELDAEMVRMFGRFRWELCRTIQGASWNNIQLKSLTSEYCDFVQFYRKNRELSDDKKDKLKLQIQKCRNNTREVFVIDYENWIKHEAHGGLVLSKPVREILASYCPFTKEMREKISEQPMFRDAMAKFTRERAKRAKEYDLKFRVWEKDGVEIPPEVVKTKQFYTEY